MDRLVIDNGYGQLVLRKPVHCDRCDEVDWSPECEGGIDLARYIYLLEDVVERFGLDADVRMEGQ